MKYIKILIILNILFASFYNSFEVKDAQANEASRIFSISSAVISPGDEIDIYGENFGDRIGNIYFSDLKIPYYGYNILYWSPSRIKVKVPLDKEIKSGLIGAQAWDGNELSTVFYGPTYYIKPEIISLYPFSGVAGEKVIISGEGFSGITILEINFSGEPAQAINQNNNSIQAIIPRNAGSGNISLRARTNDASRELIIIGPYFKIIKEIAGEEIEDQWYLKEINISAAWDYSSGSHDIVVAVIDDGIFLNHPDLQKNIWVNKNEIEGNLIDDDGNGYIDDRFGWDFAEESDDMSPVGTHGTMVAGIIGASGSGEIKGINKNVSLMSLIVSDGRGEIAPKDIINAIYYAVDNGAHIINLSVGSGSNKYSEDFDKAIKYAFDNNVLIVAAAGNGDTENGKKGRDLSSIKISPACNDLGYNAILGVGSSNRIGERAPWSNYGDCVDVYAPGEEITSTAYFKNKFPGHSYETYSGTSFSAPIVAGIAALIKAKYPGISVVALRDKIINNADIKNGLKLVNAQKSVAGQFSTDETIVKTGEDSGKNIAVKESWQLKKAIEKEKLSLAKIDLSLAEKLSGQILIQIEESGQAWYIFPKNNKRYYLGRPEDAFNIMKKLGMGASHKFITSNKIFPESLLGRILIDVEDNGKAYYINPRDKKTYYLGRPEQAFEVIKKLGLGISNKDIRKIDLGEIK